MILEIDAVWCRTHIEFNAIKNNGDYDAAISYHKIYHRLLKSDPDSLAPSNILIAIQIRKEINKVVRNKSSNSRVRVLYMLKDLDPLVVDNLNQLIGTMDVNDRKINLIIVKNAEVANSSVLQKFNSVINIE